MFSEELVLTFSVKDQLAFLGRQLLSGKLVVLKGGGGGGEGEINFINSIPEAKYFIPSNFRVLYLNISAFKIL